MTDNTEPTIEELVERVYLFGMNGGLGYGKFENELSPKEATRLISDQVAKARIDELIGVRGWTEYEPDPKYSPAERFHIVPYTYLTNRIAELNGVKE